MTVPHVPTRRPSWPTRIRWAAQSALVGSVVAGATLGWWWPHPSYDAVHLGGALAGLTAYLAVRRIDRSHPSGRPALPDL